VSNLSTEPKLFAICQVVLGLNPNHFFSALCFPRMLPKASGDVICSHSKTTTHFFPSFLQEPLTKDGTSFETPRTSCPYPPLRMNPRIKNLPPNLPRLLPPRGTYSKISHNTVSPIIPFGTPEFPLSLYDRSSLLSRTLTFCNPGLLLYESMLHLLAQANTYEPLSLVFFVLHFPAPLVLVLFFRRGEVCTSFPRLKHS